VWPTRIPPVPLLLLGLALGPCAAGESDPEPLRAAHDFTARDINPASTTHGQRLSLSELYAPRGVVLNFLASWCTHCWEELPELEKLHASRQARIVGVAADEYGAPVSVVLGLVERAGLTIPVLFVPRDQAPVLERHYDHEMLPATYVIDRQGRIRSVMQGATPPEELRDEIFSLLPAVEPATPR
jgi:thiol-disulfide isomerase/thioredoxin